MQNISVEEAWKEISGSFSWSETLLEKYQDKVDWEEISKNREIHWTIPMLRKFQKKINWDKLSEFIDSDGITENMIEAFKNQWNWHELSNNITFTHELLEKYADRWDWSVIIKGDYRFHRDYRHNDNCIFEKGIDFFERYKEHIPISKLQESSLWEKIVKQQKNQLIEEIKS